MRVGAQRNIWSGRSLRHLIFVLDVVDARPMKYGRIGCFGAGCVFLNRMQFHLARSISIYRVRSRNADAKLFRRNNAKCWRKFQFSKYIELNWNNKNYLLSTFFLLLSTVVFHRYTKRQTARHHSPWLEVGRLLVRALLTTILTPHKAGLFLRPITHLSQVLWWWWGEPVESYF